MQVDNKFVGKFKNLGKNSKFLRVSVDYELFDMYSVLHHYLLNACVSYIKLFWLYQSGTLKFLSSFLFGIDIHIKNLRNNYFIMIVKKMYFSRDVQVQSRKGKF